VSLPKFPKAQEKSRVIGMPSFPNWLGYSPAAAVVGSKTDADSAAARGHPWLGGALVGSVVGSCSLQARWGWRLVLL